MNENLTRANEPRNKSDRPAVRPRVDVFENENEYLVVADVPGVAKDAFDVRFEQGELRLEAAAYRRAFAMPDGVDADKIEAELAQGILKVHLPKSAAKRPRRIDIRAS